jgi:predicted branched-subunit amino acid permease
MSRPPDGDRLTARVLTVAVAVGAFGLAFGSAAAASGMPPALVVLSSVVVFAGASQFAFVAVAAVAGPLAGALSGLLLNVRLIAFGVALGPRLGPGSLGARVLDGYLTTDESAAIALDGPPEGTRRRLRLAGAAVGAAWLMTTAAGALGGAVLDVRALGLDVAFPATFLALLAPALRTRGGRATALVAGPAAVALVPVLPAGLPVLVAGLLALPLGLRLAAGRAP